MYLFDRLFWRLQSEHRKLEIIGREFKLIKEGKNISKGRINFVVRILKSVDYKGLKDLLVPKWWSDKKRLPYLLRRLRDTDSGKLDLDSSFVTTEFNQEWARRRAEKRKKKRK